MLPQWDPNRLPRNFVVGLCGGRRQGKSVGVSDLIVRMKSRFDLVIAFVGSAACNPVLETLMSQHWDPRFFFSHWEPKLIETLLVQQEELKRSGVTRNILIIVDDVILNSDADEQLAHMAMRGRHFNVNLLCCSVSYTTLPKRARRSLDCLLIYSCPMQGDMKVLTFEYAQKARMARFALSHLSEYECLVLECLEKRQKLYVWRADYWKLSPPAEGEGPGRTHETSRSLVREKYETSVSGDCASEHRRPLRPGCSGGSPDRTRYEEPRRDDRRGETEESPPE